MEKAKREGIVWEEERGGMTWLEVGEGRGEGVRVGEEQESGLKREGIVCEEGRRGGGEWIEGDEGMLGGEWEEQIGREAVEGEARIIEGGEGGGFEVKEVGRELEEEEATEARL